MRRILALTALLISLFIVASGHTHADIIHGAKGCFSEPGNIPVTCPPTPVPTALPIAIEKNLAVGGGLTQPDGVTDYTIQITSRVACFPQNEPIFLSTLGNPQAAAISPATPGAIPVQNPNNYLVNVDKNGTAVLSLEVATQFIGTGGMGVVANWPQENLTKLVQLYPPATQTPTPVGTPAPTATETPVPVPTSATPAATSTPLPQAFFLRACVTPNPILPGAVGTVYVQTAQGAACNVSVLFSNGTSATNLNGLVQAPGPSGVAGFTFVADATGSSMGLAIATCSLAGQTLSTDVFFNIVQTTATPAVVRQR